MAEIESIAELKKAIKKAIEEDSKELEGKRKIYYYPIRIFDLINSFEASVKGEAIGIQEAFEEVWKKCPEVKVSLYGALTRQKELLFRILGIKYRPVRSVEELRSILEGEVDAETAEAKEMNCKNCGRSDKVTRILLHHIVPRELYGEDEQNTRLPLCAACERFIHFRYSNQVLAELKEKVLQKKEVQLFGVFVKSPEYIRHADIRDIENDFEKWKGRGE